MINKIWPGMIVVSFVFAVILGKINEFSNAIFVSFENTMEVIISLTAILCFWSGMINILKNTRIMGFLRKILLPFVNVFFKNVRSDIKNLIMINVVSNMLGIGNAATPSGIKALEEMDKDCDGENMSYEMNFFVLINTLSIQIIPTTIMSIMGSMGGKNISRIIIPIWIVSVSTFLIISFLGRIILRDKEGDKKIG